MARPLAYQRVNRLPALTPRQTDEPLIRNQFVEIGGGPDWTPMAPEEIQEFYRHFNRLHPNLGGVNVGSRFTALQHERLT